MKSESVSEPEAEHGHGGVDIAVVFTTVDNTLASLHVADQLTSDLAARITLLFPESVEQSTSSITPTVPAAFTSRCFLETIPQEVKSKIRIARYPVSTEDLWEVLPPCSIIVMAGVVNRFWPSAEQRFARHLRHAGHEVILLSTQAHGRPPSCPCYASA